jgi:hypothetical protein
MPIKVKAGMAGSRAGRGRGEKTAELKNYSKTARRRQAKKDIAEVPPKDSGG